MPMTLDINHSDGFSRRDFLKVSAAAMFSLFALPVDSWHTSPVELGSENSKFPRYGRVFKDNTNIYLQSSFSAEKAGKLPGDKVSKILSTTTGEEDKSGNNLWFGIEEGFIHSASVQPVEARLNPAYREVTRSRLAEVTVPFTDAYRKPGQVSSYVYRYYYGSTHWVTDASIDDNKVWYKVLNERGKALFVNATHLHLFEPEELQPISLEIPIESKRIEIHLEKQILRAYEKDTLVLETRVSTGAEYSDGNFVTDRGQYITNRKRPSRHMVYQAASRANSYDLPGVPWVSYLTTTGVSIHGTYWHNDYGRPRSHGCINLTPEASRWIYLWTQPVVPFEKGFWAEENGTRVDII